MVELKIRFFNMNRFFAFREIAFIGKSYYNQFS